MKSKLITTALAVVLSSVMSAAIAVADPGKTVDYSPLTKSSELAGTKLQLRNQVTGKFDLLSIDDVSHADQLRPYLMGFKGVNQIYEAYLKAGYFPLHAMLLANWDTLEVLRKSSPGIPENTEMKARMDAIRAIYERG